MNVGSLFSGVGGLDLGLARAGHHHAYLCEWDAWRREVLAERFPGVEIHDDVRSLDGAAARIGLLAGGSPCQDVSVAGKRAGLAGERSRLFHEFVRVADESRAPWILFENVRGLLSSNGGRDFGVVLGSLAELGYGLAWRVLDSRYFGVPQRRRRVFIVGALAGGDPRTGAERAGQVLAVGTRCGEHPKAGGEAKAEVAGTLGGSAGAHGADNPFDRGGALVPLYASLSGVGSGGPDDNDGQAGRIIPSPNGVRKLTPLEWERLQGMPDGWTDVGPRASDAKRYSAIGDAVTVPVAGWIGARLARMAAIESRL